MLLAPADVTSDDGITAVSRVAETKVVARLLPTQRTTEVGTKPPPSTVRIKPPLLIKAADGEILEMKSPVLGVTLKFMPFEFPPPGVGLLTVIEKLPTLVRSDAGMTAVSWVDETKVVVRLLPAQRTTEVGTKSPPLTVRVN